MSKLSRLEAELKECEAARRALGAKTVATYQVNDTGYEHADLHKLDNHITLLIKNIAQIKQYVNTGISGGRIEKMSYRGTGNG